MDDDRFFSDVAILTEAARINPAFAIELDQAGTDERVDQLVEDARKIIEDATQEGY
jgi:hypothetical protein